MDIQAEKLDIIRWLAGINDARIIKQFRVLKKSNEEIVSAQLSQEEKNAIDKGLKSIKEGRFQTHEGAIKISREKYPNLFK